MLNKFIARRLSYPLQDIVNGTNIIAASKFLLKSQYWSTSEMEHYQFLKFIKLFKYAYENVPFYNKMYKDAGLVSGDIKTRDDIKNIPILTKEKAREFNELLISKTINTNKVIKGVTGGTTGPPLKLLKDQQDQTFVWGAFYRWYNWMGIDIGDRISKIWGTPTVLNYPLKKRLRNSFKNFYYNRQIIDSFNINDSTIPEYISRINHFKPKLIRGYLSALIQIAEYMQNNNIRFNYTPVAVSSTTETLMPAFKKLIEDTFHSKLYDQYGCGECNSIAFDAGDGNGLYIAMEHVLLEILNEKDEHISEGDGRFIITNLDNFAMPFIRYENGDWGSFGNKSIKSDINLPVLNKVGGRSADTITLKSSSKVHGVFFTDILNELFINNPKEIHRFQVYQEKSGEIEFRIESKNSPDPIYLEKLYQALTRFFNKVKIVNMPALPLDKSGKFRYVVSGINGK